MPSFKNRGSKGSGGSSTGKKQRARQNDDLANDLNPRQGGSDPADTASPKLKRRWSERQEEQRKHKEKDDEHKEKDDEEFAPRKALKKKKKRLSQKKAKEGKKKKEAKMKQATADSKAQSVLT